MSEEVLRIRPGTLVKLSTKVQGGVHYQRVDIEDRLEGPVETKVWQTTKVVEDVNEDREAGEIRKQCRLLIAGGCQWTPFGLICLEGQEEELNGRLARARSLANEFNDRAQHSRISIAVLRGKIARDDHEAIIAIRQEIGNLLELLQKATNTGDVRSIRDLCRQAKAMDRLLEENTEPSNRLQQAVGAARKLARTIVADVERRGESLETVLAQANLGPISAARFAFLGQPRPKQSPEPPGEEGEA